MKRLTVFLVISVLVFSGCGKEKVPAEPSPDLQEIMQSRIDMGHWMTQSQYIFTMCKKAALSLQMAYEDRTESEATEYAAKISEHFNSMDGLLMRLKSKQTGLENEKLRLEVLANKDIGIFSSLTKCNSLSSELIDLLSVAPESITTFTETFDAKAEQLDSIYRTLKIEFPESADELSGLMAKDNLDYVADMKMIENIPTPLPKATPTPIEESPDATPTMPQAKVWTDGAGVLHMGHNPPDDANLQEIKSQLSGSIETSNMPPATETTTDTKQSVIWVDENNVTHMGSAAPEGVESKPADEIKLMVE